MVVLVDGFVFFVKAVAVDFVEEAGEVWRDEDVVVFFELPVHLHDTEGFALRRRVNKESILPEFLRDGGIRDWVVYPRSRFALRDSVGISF